MDTNLTPSPFSSRRLGLLLRRDVAYGYRGTLVAAASVAGVVILFSLVSMFGIGARGEDFHYNMFTSILFIGGFIYTSLVFRELHREGSAVPFLTLPSSGLEKFASKALVTSVGYAVAVLLFSTATSAVSEGVNWLIFKTNHRLFNPLDTVVLRGVAAYIVTQAVFLVGSVYFRKMAFLKTVGILSLLTIAAAALSSALVYSVLRDQLVVISSASGASVQPPPALVKLMADIGSGARPTPPVLEALKRVAEVLFWAGLAPACWLMGYLKMREKEV